MWSIDDDLGWPLLFITDLYYSRVVFHSVSTIPSADLGSRRLARTSRTFRITHQYLIWRLCLRLWKDLSHVVTFIEHLRCLLLSLQCAYSIETESRAECDVLHAADRGEVSILRMLDLSAGFDTVNHSWDTDWSSATVV